MATMQNTSFSSPSVYSVHSSGPPSRQNSSGSLYDMDGRSIPSQPPLFPPKRSPPGTYDPADVTAKVSPRHSTASLKAAHVPPTSAFEPAAAATAVPKPGPMHGPPSAAATRQQAVPRRRRSISQGAAPPPMARMRPKPSAPPVAHGPGPARIPAEPYPNLNKARAPRHPGAPLRRMSKSIPSNMNAQPDMMVEGGVPLPRTAPRVSPPKPDLPLAPHAGPQFSPPQPPLDPRMPATGARVSPPQAPLDPFGMSAPRPTPVPDGPHSSPLGSSLAMTRAAPPAVPRSHPPSGTHTPARPKPAVLADIKRWLAESPEIKIAYEGVNECLRDGLGYTDAAEAELDCLELEMIERRAREAAEKLRTDVALCQRRLEEIDEKLGLLTRDTLDLAPNDMEVP